MSITAGRGPDPIDTLAIVGGRSIARVDAQAVALAASRLDDAAASLRAASYRCAVAANLLEDAMWAPAPFAAPVSTGSAARRRAAARVVDTAQRLAERADTCDGLSTRIRRVAGLYTYSESAAERVLGALVAAGSGVVTLETKVLTRSTATGPVVLAGAAAGAALAYGMLPRPSADDVARLTRDAAPFTDEAIAGLAFGVAVGSPLRSGFDTGVTGGARVLSSIVHQFLPVSTVQVLPVPDATARPSWAGTPSGTVAEALARTADLYPWGSGILGRPAPGLPEATLAVEQVEHDDGTTSWTVLIPGTQSPIPPDHPFDAVTDIDLMAHEAADVTAAVELALAKAGARPDEPVVLVGHSLGGIAAMALASSGDFRRRHRLGGVVTAGSPTATFTAPRGVPVLHLENDEELVSQLDGRTSTENPATRDRVTVGRTLAASGAAPDRETSGSVIRAHGMSTHLRTLELAREAGSAPVATVVGRIDALLDGERADSRFFTAARTFEVDGPVVLAPGDLSPSSARTVR